MVTRRYSHEWPLGRKPTGTTSSIASGHDQLSIIYCTWNKILPLNVNIKLMDKSSNQCNSLESYLHIIMTNFYTLINLQRVTDYLSVKINYSIISKYFFNCRYFEIYSAPFGRLSLFGRLIPFAKQHINVRPVCVCPTMHHVSGMYYTNVQPLGGYVCAWVPALRCSRTPQSADDTGLQTRWKSGASGCEGGEWSGQWVTFDRSQGTVESGSIGSRRK